MGLSSVPHLSALEHNLGATGLPECTERSRKRSALGLPRLDRSRMQRPEVIVYLGSLPCPTWTARLQRFSCRRLQR